VGIIKSESVRWWSMKDTILKVWNNHSLLSFICLKELFDQAVYQMEAIKQPTKVVRDLFASNGPTDGFEDKMKNHYDQLLSDSTFAEQVSV